MPSKDPNQIASDWERRQDDWGYAHEPAGVNLERLGEPRQGVVILRDMRAMKTLRTWVHASVEIGDPFIIVRTDDGNISVVKLADGQVLEFEPDE